jgi:UDP-N-acetylglucosamine diphosphorylase/glucosamine-1-phosphate N-acetyltransferase
MTDLRAAFELRTGMYTTAGRVATTWPKRLAGYWVPEPLRGVVADRANAPVNILPDEEVVACINGRWAVPDASLHLNVGEAIVEESTGHVVASVLRRSEAEYLLNTGQLHERVRVRRRTPRVLYRYPWDVIAFMHQTIPHDLDTVRMLDARIAADCATIVGQHPVEIHASAKIGPNVVLDAEKGPVVIHEGVEIRPNCVLCGPCSIGRGSTIVDRAHIKACTVIGPVCKVGGEVGATIFQGYSNKSHDGHLGDSWIGRWVNFGAGTTNSNLLNTYGEVTMRVEPDGPRHRTGLTFLGCIVGDHVKTAIGTRLMTGTMIGTGAMIACTAPPPAIVRRFAWLTDGGERLYRYEKFVEMMRAAMQRRDKTPAEAYLTLIRELHDHVAQRSRPSTSVAAGQTP